uniref:Putative secreted protein n=1 Tax=Amblyomma cajennense TaxID=34607 RepID=A0A023FBZ6_AMBCJ
MDAFFVWVFWMSVRSTAHAALCLLSLYYGMPGVCGGVKKIEREKLCLYSCPKMVCKRVYFCYINRALCTLQPGIDIFTTNGSICGVSLRHARSARGIFRGNFNSFFFTFSCPLILVRASGDTAYRTRLCSFCT